jgi:hypothetical protein
VERAGGMGRRSGPNPFGADAGKIRHRPGQSSVRRLRKLVCGGAPGGAAPFAEGRASRGRRRNPALIGARNGPSQGPYGASQAPGASRRSISLRGTEKGTRRTPRLSNNRGGGACLSNDRFRPVAAILSSCPRLSRASTSFLRSKDVDGRDKPGHDEGVDGRVKPGHDERIDCAPSRHDH